MKVTYKNEVYRGWWISFAPTENGVSVGILKGGNDLIFQSDNHVNKEKAFRVAKNHIDSLRVEIKQKDEELSNTKFPTKDAYDLACKALHKKTNILNSVKEYLKDHESDIAYEANDFGSLKQVFYDLFDREPQT